MPDICPIEEVDSLSGSDYLGVQTAMNVLALHDLDLAGYTILFLRKGNATIVVFSPRKVETDKNQRAVDLEFEAEMKASDLRALMSELDQGEVMKKVQGSCMRAIHLAATVFLGRWPRAELAQYEIDLSSERDLLSISFLDKGRRRGVRGNGGRPGFPGFEVALNCTDLSLVKAHFVR
jgi:hypothetical protein